MSTPSPGRWHVPAEWERHSRCWMAWPRHARGWPGGLDAAAAAHAELARTIAAFEPVTMICAPDDGVDASLACGAGVQVLPLEIGSGWLRDTGLRPPGGESFDEVQSRIERARERIIAEHGASTVLVVSHVTPIKTLLRLALGAGISILHRLHLDLASLSIAEFYPDDGASVRLVNDTSYLRG